MTMTKYVHELYHELASFWFWALIKREPCVQYTLPKIHFVGMILVFSNAGGYAV